MAKPSEPASKLANVATDTIHLSHGQHAWVSHGYPNAHGKTRVPSPLFAAETLLLACLELQIHYRQDIPYQKPTCNRPPGGGSMLRHLRPGRSLERVTQVCHSGIRDLHVASESRVDYHKAQRTVPRGRSKGTCQTSRSWSG